MIFTALKLEGAFLIEQERHHDERGFFARTFCAKEFAEQGLCDSFVQHNTSYNQNVLVTRGMHWQAEPHGEIKVVSCGKGRIFDVIVDVRPESSTFSQWQGFELSPGGGQALYIPEGFAHGFIALETHTYVNYLMSTPYVPGYARGFRFDDPDVGIQWPHEARHMSERDRALPSLRQALDPEAS